MMDSLLRDGVQLPAFATRAFAGDSHFFDEVATPEKIREFLESNKVNSHVATLKIS
jgi:hypothetical protein